MTSERRPFLQSARGLTLALAVIALLAFVLPSVGAARLNQGRLTRARQQVVDVSRALAAAGLDGLGARLDADDIGVLSGGGDAVLQATDRLWLTARLAPLPSYLTLSADVLAPDPWLRTILVNVGARRRGGRVWVLSAGPNGIIETPFASSDASSASSAPGAPGAQDLTVPRGDDIVAPAP